MKRLYVGCRVRFVRPDRGSAERGLVFGDEGIIEAAGFHVDFHVSVVGKRNPNRTLGGAFPAFAYELEPIQDPGHQACDADFKRDLDRLLERQGIAA